jgi:nitroreductase
LSIHPLYAMMNIMRITPYKKLDPMFIERHSPRSFANTPVPEEDLKTILEAARWSPSCFNEQPWVYAYAQGDARQKFKEVLVEFNWQWASKAPVLLIVFANKIFKQNGKPNRWAGFDAGSSWMSLAFQAEKLGYITHGMGGFDEAQALKVAGLNSEHYEAMAVIALGKEGNIKDLPPEIQAKEIMTERKDLKEMIFEIV